jgi:hypothetical protein
VSNDGTDATAPDAASDASGTDAAPPPPPDFSCLGLNAPPPPTTPSAALTFTVAEASTPDNGLAGVTVAAFDRTDLAETLPLGTTVSDATGAAMLAVPLGAAGWDGFLKLSGDAMAMLRTTYAYRDKAVTADVDLGPVVIINETSLTVLEATAGATQDLAQGEVGMQLVDCAGAGVPETTIALSVTGASTSIVYVRGGLPLAANPSSDGSGAMLIFNAPVGPLTVTFSAPLAPGGAPQTISTLAVDVRAGVFTTAAVTPD